MLQRKTSSARQTASGGGNGEIVERKAHRGRLWNIFRKSEHFLRGICEVSHSHESMGKEDSGGCCSRKNKKEYEVSGNKSLPSKFFWSKSKEMRIQIAMILARAWTSQAVGIALAKWLKLRRQMTAAAGKNESVSLSLHMEVHNLEFEEELSTMATLFLGGRRVDGQMEAGAAEGVEQADL